MRVYGGILPYPPSPYFPLSPPPPPGGRAMTILNFNNFWTAWSMPKVTSIQFAQLWRDDLSMERGKDHMAVSILLSPEHLQHASFSALHPGGLRPPDHLHIQGGPTKHLQWLSFVMIYCPSMDVIVIVTYVFAMLLSEQKMSPKISLSLTLTEAITSTSTHQVLRHTKISLK